MDVQDWGAIGEIIGGVGVVVSLIYLALQVRQNTLATRHNAFHEIVRDQTEAFNLMNVDAELTQIVYEGFTDFRSLTRDQQRRFEVWHMTWLRMLENLLYEVEHQRIDASEWTGIREHQKFALGRPGFAEWWNTRQNLFHARLQNFINEEVLSTIR